MGTMTKKKQKQKKTPTQTTFQAIKCRDGTKGWLIVEPNFLFYFKLV